MNTPKANEYVQQLWTSLDADGDLACDNVQPRVTRTATIPCRLIPGHGKVVPLELVDAIERAAQFFDDHNPYIDDAVSESWDIVIRAIDAAAKGAV
jgi:hypothetical protein